MDLGGWLELSMPCMQGMKESQVPEHEQPTLVDTLWTIVIVAIAAAVGSAAAAFVAPPVAAAVQLASVDSASLATALARKMCSVDALAPATAAAHASGAENSGIVLAFARRPGSAFPEHSAIPSEALSLVGDGGGEDVVDVVAFRSCETDAEHACP